MVTDAKQPEEYTCVCHITGTETHSLESQIFGANFFGVPPQAQNNCRNPDIFQVESTLFALLIQDKWLCLFEVGHYSSLSSFCITQV